MRLSFWYIDKKKKVLHKRNANEYFMAIQFLTTYHS